MTNLVNTTRSAQLFLATSSRGTARHRRAFTLVEVLLSMAIIGILLGISGVAVRSLAERSVIAQATNAVLTYAQVARTYAITNRIETMLVVNPVNGRFEIWHLNPPVNGGAWDPQSENQPDGYAFAPVLDASASVPLNRSNKQPKALVLPIDYLDRTTGGTLNVDTYMDNFKWPAFCFDQNGQLIIRSRRIATRTYLYPNGQLRPNPNRLADGTPDPAMLSGGALVTNGDSLITSTQGFVISDFAQMRCVIDVATVTPQSLIDNWLTHTLPGGQYAPFAATVVLNRFSGDQLTGDR